LTGADRVARTDDERARQVRLEVARGRLTGTAGQPRVDAHDHMVASLKAGDIVGRADVVRGGRDRRQHRAAYRVDERREVNDRAIDRADESGIGRLRTLITTGNRRRVVDPNVEHGRVAGTRLARCIGREGVRNADGLGADGTGVHDDLDEVGNDVTTSEVAGLDRFDHVLVLANRTVIEDASSCGLVIGQRRGRNEVEREISSGCLRRRSVPVATDARRCHDGEQERGCARHGEREAHAGEPAFRRLWFDGRTHGGSFVKQSLGLCRFAPISTRASAPHY
jgi:hypothetical protein